MNIVLSQPMFFPWIGMFEQIRLADIYVDYSDVQFSKGSFVNRVQIKTSNGIKWLTVPLQGPSLGQTIHNVLINDQKDWRNQHKELLKQSYVKAPYYKEMIALVEQVYATKYQTINEISQASLAVICEYFDLDKSRQFLRAKDLDVLGSSSQRVFDIVQKLEGTNYITGLGALKYLDHNLFDAAGIKVSYMSYNKKPYPQLHGEFTPFVSVLDLIANMGIEGKPYISSEAIYWKDFIALE